MKLKLNIYIYILFWQNGCFITPPLAIQLTIVWNHNVSKTFDSILTVTNSIDWAFDYGFLKTDRVHSFFSSSYVLQVKWLSFKYCNEFFILSFPGMKTITTNIMLIIQITLLWICRIQKIALNSIHSIKSG